MNRNVIRGLVTAGVLAVTGAAQAAAGDPDVSAITAAGATVALIGGAVFVVMVGIKLQKWIRRAL
jgi:hypothetical protein